MIGLGGTENDLISDEMPVHTLKVNSEKWWCQRRNKGSGRTCHRGYM